MCAALSIASELSTLPHVSHITRSTTPGSQFALSEDFDKLELSVLIIGLIVVTILYEKVRAARAALPADTRAGRAPTTRTRCAVAAAAEQPPSRRVRGQGTEYLEEHVFRKGIAAVLLNKMTRELAILGFVSFTATVFMQFDVSRDFPKASTARGCPFESPRVYAHA